MCKHKKQKFLCIACGGSAICKHKKQKQQCIECSPANVCLKRQTARYRIAYKRRKSISELKMLELLGCSTKDEFYEWTLAQLEEDGLDFYDGVWSYDHIKPVRSFDLTDSEQVKKCFHTSNLQTMTMDDNRSKGISY